MPRRKSDMDMPVGLIGARVELERVLAFTPPALASQWSATLVYPARSAKRPGRTVNSRGHFLGPTASGAVKTLLAYLEAGGEGLMLAGREIDIEAVARGEVRAT